MAAFSQFLSHLRTLTIVFLTLLILEIIIFVRSITGTFISGDSPITAAQYLKLIERKNPASRYKRNQTEESNDCTVCLSTFEEGEEIRKVKECKHIFHKDCLDTWLQQGKPTCPLCRINVLPEEIAARYRRGRDNPGSSNGSEEEMMVLLTALQGNYLRRLAAHQ